jgi:uncharacterized protein YbaR (Trm112 family)/2-polyprenyl-3-methyl-5-hydroxy-6-metoxy-1,4-benzoquinol methylase
MYRRLLELLRCPTCGHELDLFSLSDGAGDAEILDGLLRCREGHCYPVIRGIPRMLPDSLEEHWGAIRDRLPDPMPDWLIAITQGRGLGPDAAYDRRTRANFSEEWSHHDLGGKTWGMDLQDRVRWFFLEPIRTPQLELQGKVLLDAGCGNGSQSVAYTELGLEVVALDISTGLEHGYAYRKSHPGARAEKVHFVQGDLQRPPLARGAIDIIHSAGVLHHTPDTLTTFRALCPLLRAGGTFYVWLYKYERVVTPIVNALRVVTTRIPSGAFARIARGMALSFMGFCAAVNALGVRSYPRMNRREAALALLDIFGAPYAYYHSYEEVLDWYREAGFEEVWPCNEGRRGFGVCGRLEGAAVATGSSDLAEAELARA